MPSPVRSSNVLLGLCVLTLVACADRTPTGVTETPPNTAAGNEYRCEVDIRAKNMSCTPAPLAGLPGGLADVVVGGQGTYVQLSNTPASANAGVFTAAVTVQNLIPQPMSTSDGTTASATGVRIFFANGPTVTGGSGTISVVPDGTAAFLTAGQAYYQYSGALLGADGILSSNETSSAKTWTFNYSAGVTNFAFGVYVSTEVPYPNGYIDVTSSSNAVIAAATQNFTGTVRSYVGNVIPGQTITWGTSDNSVATINSSGVLTGVTPGTVTVTASAGVRSGTTSVDVCPSIALGQAYTFVMPVGSRFCLAGSAGGNQYTVVPVNASGTVGASVALSVTGSGIVAVSGTPTPDIIPGTASPLMRAQLAERAVLTQDYSFERKLRERSRELGALMGRARSSIANPTVSAQSITPGVPVVGDLMHLNVETDNSCGTSDMRTGRVEAVGTHIIVLADSTNPSGLTAADYQAIADEFDSVVYPTDTGAFGAPSDIDSNGRVIAFYTTAVNALTPSLSSSYIGGFFFSRDIFPAAACPTSNVGEMFYMLAADPTGTINGNVRSVDLIKSTTVGTLAHEFQHLINASRRFYVNGAGGFEEVWLDEGLAHIAEELMFYAKTGLSAGSNVDIAALTASPSITDNFFSYGEANFGRLRQWLLSPIANGPFQLDDDLATRGVIWAFLRYVRDRGGNTSFFYNLVNSTTSGMTNLTTAMGIDPLSWYTDFAAAMYADDGISGAPSNLTNPSWNFRNIYSGLDYDPGPGCSCGYELAVRNPSNGVSDNFTLVAGGGAGYVRVGVPATGFATITVKNGGVTPPAAIKVVVIRRK